MKVTHDKYQLPLVIADTCSELARLCNTNTNNIRSLISKQKHNVIEFAGYVVVEIEDNEDEEENDTTVNSTDTGTKY